MVERCCIHGRVILSSQPTALHGTGRARAPITIPVLRLPINLMCFRVLNRADIYCSSRFARAIRSEGVGKERDTIRNGKWAGGSLETSNRAGNYTIPPASVTSTHAASGQVGQFAGGAFYIPISFLSFRKSFLLYGCHCLQSAYVLILGVSFRQLKQTQTLWK